MKISASYWMFEGGLGATLPVADAMAQAKDLGFDAIELCIGSQGVLTHEAPHAECEQIVAQANELGIEIASVASGESWGSSPSDDDPAVRVRIIDFTKKALQVTNWLGADAYLFVPGAVDVFFLEDSPVVPYDVCYERAREAVTQLVPTAEQLGVTLGIENVWNKFLLSPLEMRDFVDSFGSASVGAYFDAGNVLLTGYPEHWIKILGERIVRIHVKDFKKSVGTAEGFVDMLEGDVDFEAVKTALAGVGY
ncbi:MAG: sugar phosphate isomerase/epimerase family protein, partial [Planctomycetota bacterium]